MSKNKREETENEVKNIPPGSPLRPMLQTWSSNNRTKNLNKIRMVHYCVEVWLTLDLPDRWP